jgi:hypothetical protein
MEAMNQEIMRMIDDMQSMRAWQKAHPLDTSDEDSYGYAFEPADTYSTEPLRFTETTLKLRYESLHIFKLLKVLNRHSPLFIQLSSQLEKLVSQLGSACITKAVMEQQGKNTNTMDRLLELLTINALRKMTAYNFRKCYDAFMESQTNYKLNPAALNLSVRWAALDRRLLATEEKIEKIKSGKIKIEGDSFRRLSTEQEGTVTTPETSETRGQSHEGTVPKIHSGSGGFLWMGRTKGGSSHR